MVKGIGRPAMPMKARGPKHRYLKPQGIAKSISKMSYDKLQASKKQVANNNNMTDGLKAYLFSQINKREKHFTHKFQHYLNK